MTVSEIRTECPRCGSTSPSRALGGCFHLWHADPELRADPSRSAPDRREIVRSHPEYPRMVEAVNKHFPAGRANSGYAIEAIYDFVTSRETGNVVLLEALRHAIRFLPHNLDEICRAGDCTRCKVLAEAEAAIQQAERT